MNKKIIFIAILLVFATLSACGLTYEGNTPEPTPQNSISYVGDAPGVSRLLATLPNFDENFTQNMFSLQTQTEPYGIVIYYEPSEAWDGSGMEITDEMAMYADYLFDNIGNLGYVEFAYRTSASEGRPEELEYHVLLRIYRDLDADTAPFAAIIAAYAMYQQNGFVLPEDHPLWHPYHMGYLHPIALRYNFLHTNWNILYAFHDISGNGRPDLLIGAVEPRSWGFFPYLVGIYTLRDGEPVPVIRYGGGRGDIWLFESSDGGIVISEGWGHMGSAAEFFYAIDENGELVLLDALFTYHPDWEHLEQTGEAIHIRLRHVSGNFWDGEQVRITEEEYIALINKYGSFGYEIGWNEIDWAYGDWPEDISRRVEIDWRHIN